MGNINFLHQLDIRLSTHEYPVYIGTNLLLDSDLLRRHICAKQVLIVTNTTIAPLYLEPIQQALTALQCDVVILEDGEQYKNQHSLSLIYDALIEQQHHRDTTLIALGGGVVGDITGYAAATYQRGVRFLQVPTTLLAQVDSSVGGKTAINHPLAKNMMGSFYQPHAVIMDINPLSTLPEREFRAGLAEVIKYGLLVGGSFLKQLQNLFNDYTHTSLASIIAQSCQIKAEIVQMDEREQGQRMLLNLGHTFAHALGAITDYKRWLHGEAVAIGLYCAALLSYRLKRLNQTNLLLVDDLLNQAQLPRRIPRDIDLTVLHNLMLRDKKVKNKFIQFILMNAPGDCYWDANVSEMDVRDALSNARE